MLHCLRFLRLNARKAAAPLLASALLLGVSSVDAADVLVTTSDDATLDAAVVAALTGFGHNVTLGPAHYNLDGTTDLSGIDAVYLQVNVNWATGLTPTAGQTQLVNFVNAGGGLVTSEWLVWHTANNPPAYTILEPILAVEPTASFNGNGTATYDRVTPNAVINAGLPDTFSFSLTSYSGTETNFTSAKPGGVVFYNSTEVNAGPLGLVGRTVGSGRVANFSTVNGIAQINDANFSRLLSNTITWSSAAVPEPGTLCLVALAGLPALGLIRRRRP